MNKGKYSFVPAGMYHNNHSGLAIYTRYHKRRNGPARLLETCGAYDRVDLPDRELLITAAGHHATAYYPSQGLYDECVMLSQFIPGVSEAFGIDSFMVNYPQAIGKEDSTHRTRRGRNYFPKGEATIISDSGGYQLLSDNLTYIDPAKIVEWYNDNVDIGLVLDIPSTVAYDGMFKRLANIQKKNTNIMLDGAANGLELMNIFHGFSMEERKQFRGICETDKIDRLAIGGFYYRNIMTSLDLLYDTIKTGHKYKHYHILGVANILQVVPIMRMAHHGLAPLITSDSATAIQECSVKGYHVFPQVFEGPHWLHIGSKAHLPSNLNELPCQCPVCSTVRYMDVFSALNNNRSCFLFMYHNMYSMSRYYKTMFDLMGSYDVKEIKEVFKAQLTGTKRRGVEEALQAIDFVDTLCLEGPKAAKARFRYYLSGIDFDVRDNGIYSDEAEDKDARVVKESRAKAIKRIKRIMDSYEQGTGKHGEKNKNREFRTNKAVISAGKKKAKTSRDRKMVEEVVNFDYIGVLKVEAAFTHDTKWRIPSATHAVFQSVVESMYQYVLKHKVEINQTNIRKMVNATKQFKVPGAIVRVKLYPWGVKYFVRAKKAIENMEVVFKISGKGTASKKEVKAKSTTKQEVIEVVIA